MSSPEHEFLETLIGVFQRRLGVRVGAGLNQGSPGVFLQTIQSLHPIRVNYAVPGGAFRMQGFPRVLAHRAPAM